MGNRDLKLPKSLSCLLLWSACRGIKAGPFDTDGGSKLMKSTGLQAESSEGAPRWSFLFYGGAHHSHVVCQCQEC